MQQWLLGGCSESPTWAPYFTRGRSLVSFLFLNSHSVKGDYRPSTLKNFVAVNTCLDILVIKNHMESCKRKLISFCFQSKL